MKNSQLYKRLRDAVEARGDDSDAVEGLSAAAARSIIGPETRPMYRSMALGVHLHGRLGSV